jgi:ATP-dependent protease Clp ATPase subunit
MQHKKSSDTLRCSFCKKSQDVVTRLISTPTELPRAYICDECVMVCHSIVEDEAGPPATDVSFEEHPLASRFLRSAEQWIRNEQEGRDASDALTDMRSLGLLMLGHAIE